MKNVKNFNIWRFGYNYLICCRLIVVLLVYLSCLTIAYADSQSVQVDGHEVTDTAVYDGVKPLFVTSDGELLLLSLPDHQGFELIKTKIGQRENVTQTPNAEYFVTISPDKKYICYKEFLLVNNHLLQVPVLYDIDQKKMLQLCEASPQVSNPIISTQGEIAYTIGRKLVLLHSDFSKFFEIDLGDTVNLLSFSPDGNHVIFNNAKEIISWIDLETGIKTDIPVSTLQGYYPRFSPNGQSLLTYRINGEVEACQLSSRVTSSFGKAECASWVNDSQLAIVNKETRGNQVISTSVLLGSLADNSIAPIWTVQGNAEVVINAGAIAVVSGTMIQLGDIKTGLWETLSLQPQTRSLMQTTFPQSVIDNGTTVQLSGVPYIHQLYDTADNFVGGDSCCNATSALMAIQYYGKLSTYPITCTRGGVHTSDYGYYVSNIYSYNGYTYNIPSSAVWGSSLAGYYGGFGYFLQDTTGTGATRANRLSEYISHHGLTSSVDWSVAGETGITKLRSEIDANYPAVICAPTLTPSGHYIICIGYVKGQHTLVFNDPYGNKQAGYPNNSGAGVWYDWPGWNNGYPNLNSVDRIIYARGSTIIPVNLTPFQPSGWSDKIVVSKTTGTHIDSSPLYTTDTLYIDWAVINNGTGSITNTFYFKLYVDGVERGNFSIAGLNANVFAEASDYSIGTLSAGTHYIKIVADVTGAVQESNESDNEYTKTITVQSQSTSFGGTVTDTYTGGAISGASVVWGSYTKTTDGSGNYRFDSVPCQTNTLIVSKSGYQTSSQSHTPPCNQSSVKNVTLTSIISSASFGGTVTDANTGSAISGASVVWGSYTKTTDGNGNYRFDSVPCQTNTLIVSKSGYQTSSQSHTPPCNQSSVKNIVLAPTPPPETHILTVASSNPNSGVLMTVNPNDKNGQGSGTTQFSRTYNNNTTVTLIAPSTAGGNTFQKWQRNGIDWTTSLIAGVTMDANYTMTAVYVGIPTPHPTPTPITETVIATVKVGDQPFGVGVNPQINRIYVSNSTSNTVSVIDGATNLVVATVGVESVPNGVEVNPQTNRIYVANAQSHSVSVIEGATNDIVATVGVGLNPVGVGVNSQTNRIYVANLISKNVSVIEGTTNNIVATVGVELNPIGVGVNPQTNRIYVANSASNTVSVIDGTSNQVVATVGVGSIPFGVGVNPQTNRIYVANKDYISSSVSVIDGATNQVVETVMVEANSVPRGVGVNPTSNCTYVCSQGPGIVSVIGQMPTPTPTVTPTPVSTRIIRLEGDLNFGEVQVGSSAQRTMTIYNDGNSTLTVSSIICPTDFSGNWNGTIGAGSSQPVTVTFSPTEEKTYNGNVIVNSNATNGTNTRPISGTGTITPPRTLMVASSNPNSGVSITVSPNDNNGLSNGTTQFTRIYNNNTSVTLTAPPTAGGNTFQKWQRNGVDLTISQTASVTMNTDYTMTAVYTTPTPIPTPTSTPVTRILTVASSNPNSGVLITISPNDNNGLSNGTTQFTRTYNNTPVTLTAPSTAGGNSFQRWQRNGVDWTNSQTTNVTMNADYTMTAVYATATPIPTPTSTPIATGNISGRVTNAATGAGIAGANVAYGTSPQNIIASATTDVNGNYLFDDVVPETYAVAVQATGYQAQSPKNVTVGSGEKVIVNFALDAIVTPTPTASPTPVASPTPTPTCNAANLDAEPEPLKLKKEEGADETVTVTCEGGTPVAGITVTATVRKGKNRVSVFPASAITDTNGQAMFTIKAKKKTGNAKVRFEADGLRDNVSVKVSK